MESAPTGRSQHSLHIVPEDQATAATVLESAVAHADAPGAVLILTGDVDSAVALANVVVGIQPDLAVVAATTVARARRVARDATVVIGVPTTILGLVRASALKLDAVQTLVVAWADLADPDLEALLADVPKEAARVIVASTGGPAVEAFVERYARRPRRVGASEDTPAPSVAVRYVTTAAATRPAALRRLLDEVDPPSAIIHVRTAASERAARASLKVLGYAAGNASVRVSRDAAVGETAQLVVLYDVPLDAAEMAAATAGSPVHVVALIEPRQLPRLRALAAALPLTLSGPAARARSQEELLRDELRATIDAGLPARELIALEPLLAQYNGVELAAAALRLLDRARSVVIAAPAPVVAPREEAPARREERPASRDERPPRRDYRPAARGDSRPPRRDDRPPRRDDRPRDDRPREDRPPRRDDRPRPTGERSEKRSGPPRSGPPRSGPPRSGPPRSGSARSGPPRSGPPRGEWAERGERLTHARRPSSPKGRGRPPQRDQ